jgi:hypothetical protein
MSKKSYFTFPSIHFAIRAEKILEQASCEFKMVPVPRSISSSCGTALRCEPGDAENILKLLQEASVPVESYHELEEKNAAGLFSFFSREGKRSS